MKIIRLRLLLSVGVLLSGCSGSIVLENDYGFPFKKNSDRYYSHATQFSYIQETEKEKQTYSLGQLIYTPSQKRPDADPEVLKKDRPYTGWLFLERRNTSYTDEDTKDTWGLQVGCTGRCSQAKEVQTGVHKLLDQGQPTWDKNYSLKSEPGFILEAERHKRLLAGEHSDFAIYGLGKFGNIIDSAAFGMDVRLGYLDRFSTEPITFKLPREEDKKHWTAYLFGRVEERLVLYNHFLSGSWWQTERHSVEEEPFVSELDLGFTVGHNDFKLSYRITIFSSEWETQKGSFGFGSLGWSW